MTFAPGLDGDSRRERRLVAAALGLCLCAAYLYFYQGGGWNQNSRYALVRAIIEQGTLRIDDTVRFDGRLITGDLAEHEDHLYSDKAPGLALAAVPAVALAYPFVAEPQSSHGIARLSYVATIVTAALPGVLAGLLVFHLAGVFGAGLGASAFAAAVFGLGSPAWCYATLFYGHTLATACIMIAFSAAVWLRAPSSPRREGVLALAVGVGGGWATVTEYTAAVPAALIALLAVAIVGQRESRRLGLVVANITTGALACVAVLVLFNVLAFGGPLTIGYTNVVGFESMQDGFFGIGGPKRGVLMGVLFGQFRGLFFLAPVLALAPIGFALLIRVPSVRLPALTALAIAVYYVLMNASYNYWHGGWSYGPRHVAPALPFLALALAPLWTLAKGALRVCLCVVALYGAGLTLVAVSTTAQPRDDVQRPVSELLWPNFVEGHLSINRQAFVEGNIQDQRDEQTHAWNIGEKLGLTGLVSLAPLFAFWSLVGVVTWRRRAT
jgi:hypothetical protein